jgi:hypothetical protein
VDFSLGHGNGFGSPVREDSRSAWRGSEGQGPGVHVVHFLDNLPLDKCDDDAIGQAGRFAAQHGIDVEIGTRGTDPEHLFRYLKIAQEMGAHLVRTMGGWHGAPASLQQIQVKPARAS